MKHPLENLKLPLLCCSLAAITHAVANAQEDGGVPLLTAEEKAAVDAQSADFSRSIEPLLADAAKSTVRVWSGSRRLAYGTVVGDGTKILTKWSELLRSRGELRVEAAGRDVRAVELIGIYADYDFAILEIEGDPLPPVDWVASEPPIGSFLAAPQPDGRLAAFGVVGVPARNLKQTDQAFIGITADPNHTQAGVRVGMVMEDSPANSAGIQQGDILLSVDGREVNGLYELRNALNGIPPGQSLPLSIQRDGETLVLDIVVGSRPELPRFPGARLQQMERMGGPISQWRDDFPAAIESDMKPLPNQIGGPVVDLKGRTVGITLARAGRTRSYVMPASAVAALLRTEPENPQQAQARMQAERESGIAAAQPTPDFLPAPQPAPGRGKGPAPERLERHLSDVQRLLDLMRQEMNALGR